MKTYEIDFSLPKDWVASKLTRWLDSELEARSMTKTPVKKLSKWEEEDLAITQLIENERN